MKAALNFKLFGAWITDLQKEIKYIYILSHDLNSTNCEMKASLSTIKSTIFPFLDFTAEVYIESWKILLAFPSLEYIHSGKENDIR